MLPKIVGLGRANDLLLTSRVFTSDEALQLGFVNQIFEPTDLVEQTLAYAHQLVTSVSPNSLRQTRWQIYKDLHRDVASSVIESERLIEDMATEEDFKEGIAALVEKRPPNWPSVR
jgi:enoyl-CoA hydratase/carnithine racemase